VRDIRVIDEAGRDRTPKPLTTLRAAVGRRRRRAAAACACPGPPGRAPAPPRPACRAACRPGPLPPARQGAASHAAGGRLRRAGCLPQVRGHGLSRGATQDTYTPLSEASDGGLPDRMSSALLSQQGWGGESGAASGCATPHNEAAEGQEAEGAGGCWRAAGRPRAWRAPRGRCTMWRLHRRGQAAGAAARRLHPRTAVPTLGCLPAGAVQEAAAGQPQQPQLQQPQQPAASEAQLEAEVQVQLTETVTVFLFNLPGTVAAADSEEGRAVAAANERYRAALAAREAGGSDRQCGAEAQTLDPLLRSRHVQASSAAAQDSSCQASGCPAA
jgi:hypothetical protein